jgi:predicted Zn-dependent peptidase
MHKVFIGRMTRWSRLSVIVAMLLMAVVASQAQTPAPSFQLNVVDHTLKNGMRVLMVERHESPTVALYMLFKVGAVNDPQGKTGIAHMLEHMMFKGTPTFGTTNYKAEQPIMEKINKVYAALAAERAKRESPFLKADEEKIKQMEAEMKDLQKQQEQYVVTDEFSQAQERLGGVGANASTGPDATDYFVSLPSNQLEVWAYLESDRIANPVFREFYPERDVVHEERRLRTDNNPDGLLWERFNATAFSAHPYRNPLVGWPSDIDNLTREEVLQYFKTYYSPNNAVVVIVGDIQPDKTVALMEKYFGRIPAQTLPPRHITDEPEQLGERRVVVRFDAQPDLMMGYHIPASGADDTYALDVMGSILTGVTRGSRTGRLYRSLVLDKKVALSASAGANTSLYPNLFLFSVTPAPGKSTAEVEKAVYEEIEKLQKELPTAEEMERVRNSVDASMIRALRSNMGVARMLASVEHEAGDWKYIYKDIEKSKAVTAEQVREVARKYFKSENRTVAELQPLEAEAGGEPADAGPSRAELHSEEADLSPLNEYRLPAEVGR